MNSRNLIKLAQHFAKLAQETEEFSQEEENDTAKVVAAIEKSKSMPHFQNTFLTRNPGPESEGSVFKTPQTPESLQAATWEYFNHPAVMSPAVAYRANIPGYFGVVNLEELPPETPVETTLGHKGEDPFVSVLVEPKYVPDNLVEADYTTILLGPEDDGEYIVWTFFPGPPVLPSTSTPEDLQREVETVKDALEEGLQYAKVKG